MSLFAYNYGEVDGYSAALTTTNATTLLTVGTNDQEITVMNIRAGLASGASQTTVRFDLYDGSTAYPVVNWITLQADEVYVDEMPIHVRKGWSLRATRGSGSTVYITGVYVQATNRG